MHLRFALLTAIGCVSAVAASSCMNEGAADLDAGTAHDGASPNSSPQRHCDLISYCDPELILHVRAPDGTFAERETLSGSVTVDGEQFLFDCDDPAQDQWCANDRPNAAQLTFHIPEGDAGRAAPVSSADADIANDAGATFMGALTLDPFLTWAPDSGPSPANDNCSQWCDGFMATVTLVDQN